MKTPEEIRGWWWPLNSKKAHYLNGDRFTLCRRMLYLGNGSTVEDSNHDSADNCAECKRRRAALLGAKGQKTENSPAETKSRSEGARASVFMQHRAGVKTGTESRPGPTQGLFGAWFSPDCKPAAPRLSPKRRAILDYVKQHGAITLAQATQLVGRDVYANAEKHTGALLSAMVRLGLITRTAPGKFALSK